MLWFTRLFRPLLLLAACVAGTAQAASPPVLVAEPAPARQLAPAAVPAPPPARVLRALARGVNLSIWFTYRGEPGVETARYTPDADDWRRIKALGLTHVRVQFDPAYFRDPAQPDALLPARVSELRRALVPAFKHGLLVVLAAEPLGAEKKRLLGDAAGVAELARFWQGFARALRDIPPQRLVFELLNEPTETDATSNRPLMQTLAEAVRKVAPRHTLVVAGHGYSGVDELAAFEPLALPNLVYTFHFYEPHNFTHQGATWSWPMLTQFKDLPYPSSPEGVALAAAAATEEARPHILYYGEQRWDRHRIATRLAVARAWTERHQRPVWCGEFGAGRLGAPQSSRLQWLTDVHAGLQASALPWSLFDYAGHFGLVIGNASERQLDPLEAEALDLQGAVRPAAAR